MQTIGFIGLGNMGGPMAANLVKAGYRVQGFDPAPAAADAARSAGVELCPDAAGAASGAEWVITMLPSGRHVVDLYQARPGILTVASPETLFIDCSTIDVESARAAHALAAEAGMLSVEAPVSGGVSGAEAATLTFMIGGDAAAVGAAQPILAAMGRRQVHCGGAGAGQAAKICNNMVLGVSMIAVAEAFVLAERLGLGAQALFDVLSTSSGQCWSVTSYCPVPGPVPASPANQGYQPGFAAALMLKDLKLARQAAAQSGAATELGHHAADIYQRFTEAGGAGSDFSAIIEAIRAQSR